MPPVVTQPPKSPEETVSRRDAMRAGVAALMGVTFGAGCASTRSGPDTASRLQLGRGVQDPLPQQSPVDLVKREHGYGVYVDNNGKAEAFVRPLLSVDEKFIVHAAAWSKIVEQKVQQHNASNLNQNLRNIVVTFEGKVYSGEKGTLLGQMNGLPPGPTLPR